MERLSRKQKYQEYRDELKKDNEAFAKSQALNDYQNKIEQLQSNFEGGQVNPNPFIQKELPPQETKVEQAPSSQEINAAKITEEYKDLFDLLEETPTVEPGSGAFEDVIYEKPAIENEFVNPVEDLLRDGPIVPPVHEEPHFENIQVEPVHEEVPVTEQPDVITTPIEEEPIIIDTTTQDYFEEESKGDTSGIDIIVQGIDSYNEQPVQEHVEPEMAEFDDIKPIEPQYEEPVIQEPEYVEPVIEEPVQEEVVIEEPVYVEPVKEEPVIEEPVAEPDPFEELLKEEPIEEEPVVELEPEVPVVEIEEEPVVEEVKPVEATQQFEPVQEPDGIEIKNIDELVQEEEINATLTDTIPFVIDDEAVKEAIEEYDEEEDDEEEEVPNKVLNVILIILIVVLVIVLGLIVYYILAGQGIIG